MFVLFVAGYFFQEFCGVCLLCGRPERQVQSILFIILQWLLEMASFAKVEEDRLVERMGDTVIKEEGILKVKFFFPS